MEEIKFRIFKEWSPIMDEITKEMVYFNLKDLCQNKFSIRELVKPSILSEDAVMQYTNLQDRHGKDIYEGDILDTSFYMGIVLVSFVNGCFLVRTIKQTVELLGLPDMNSTTSKYDTLSRGYLGSIVIGNIYENPELLE